MSYLMTVMYAFCDAYYNAPVEAFGELIAEAIDLIKTYASEQKDTEIDTKEFKGKVAAALKTAKSGRAISAANRAKIKAIIKAVQDHHEAHGIDSNNVIAALKDLCGPDEGNEGEEKQATPVSPKPKVEVRDIRQVNDGFEDIMTARRVLRKVDDVVGKALSDLNSKFRENHSARR
jgi:hypothetical protein